MIRILHVFGRLNRGGAETLIMNLYRAINRQKIQFDFIVHTSEQGEYEVEIIDLGGKIFRMRRFNMLNLVNYMHSWRSFLRTHPEYHAVHIHVSNFAFAILPELRRAGVPIRIVHAHSTSDESNIKRILVRAFQKYIYSNATHRFAVSSLAGHFVFGHRKKVRILPNAINLDQFRFDQKMRQQQRASLNLRNRLVVGHIGRFTIEKNHTFLLQIFAALLCRRPDAILLLVGDGPLRSEIERLSRVRGVEGNVCFLGVRSDVGALVQAMDVFCFPSLFEGLGIAAIEAQAAGLPCLCSDRIPDEACVVPSIFRFMPLKVSAEAWAEAILEMAELPRGDTKALLRAAHFDVIDQARWYERLYAQKEKSI